VDSPDSSLRKPVRSTREPLAIPTISPSAIFKENGLMAAPSPALNETLSMLINENGSDKLSMLSPAQAVATPLPPETELQKTYFKHYM
jgi:hypothetical protein